ncbi:MAG: creatininase family protein [Candidatus Dormibacteraceae bacterium]
MTNASCRFGDRTRTALRTAVEDVLVVFPLGATEQHGPHLPVATDSLLVEMIAEQAALKLEGSIPVLVAPTLAFGSSAHHLPFGATLSLPTTTYLTVLMELGKSAFTCWFRRVFFLNGHGGNAELAELAARDVAIE